MVVDDEPAIRRIVARYLSATGCTVSTACNARECISAFKSGEFDVLVSDVDLGDVMDGIALADHLRSADARLRIVLMSGMPSHQSRARSIGVRVLHKPFELTDLLDAIFFA